LLGQFTCPHLFGTVALRFIVEEAVDEHHLMLA
jgi:hypothetical protein